MLFTDDHNPVDDVIARSLTEDRGVCSPACLRFNRRFGYQRDLAGAEQKTEGVAGLKFTRPERVGTRATL